MAEAKADNNKSENSIEIPTDLNSPYTKPGVHLFSNTRHQMTVMDAAAVAQSDPIKLGTRLKEAGYAVNVAVKPDAKGQRLIEMLQKSEQTIKGKSRSKEITVISAETRVTINSRNCIGFSGGNNGTLYRWILYLFRQFCQKFTMGKVRDNEISIPWKQVVKDGMYARSDHAVEACESVINSILSAKVYYHGFVHDNKGEYVSARTIMNIFSNYSIWDNHQGFNIALNPKIDFRGFFSQRMLMPDYTESLSGLGMSLTLKITSLLRGKYKTVLKNKQISISYNNLRIALHLPAPGPHLRGKDIRKVTEIGKTINPKRDMGIPIKSALQEVIAAEQDAESKHQRLFVLETPAIDDYLAGKISVSDFLKAKMKIIPTASQLDYLQAIAERQNELMKYYAAQARKRKKAKEDKQT